MSDAMSTYLMISEEDDYGMMIEGPDPTSAVQSHYDEMNSYCSADLDEEERFSVTVYSIRTDDAARVEDEVESLGAGDYLNYVAQLEASGRSISSQVVHLLMATDGSAKVLCPEVGPNLFDRIGEG